VFVAYLPSTVQFDHSVTTYSNWHERCEWI